ncbi:Serine/threonine-protein phosphatase 2A activator 2 [Savitreella phatthalungensis]
MVIPRRRIVSESDLAIFRSHPSSYGRVSSFISDLNSACCGLSNDAVTQTYRPGIHALLKILDAVDALVDANPPIDNAGSRFGNPAFRSFYDAVRSCSRDLHTTLSLSLEHADEAGTYLVESFGNRTRVDYGSGHELNFICWLICMAAFGVVKVDGRPGVGELPGHKLRGGVTDVSGLACDDDAKELVLVVFTRYLRLMRKVQAQYWLEPAGSHGVWGLDDFHFLPFVFGSSQLRTHPHLRPASIRDSETLRGLSHKYMYLGCIAHLHETKSGAVGLRWHSPMLDDISAAKSWAKVNDGMMRMYDVEVLGKVPVVQHFLFGGVIPAPDGVSPAPALDDHGNEHIHNTWADCCGIKVPSAVAAGESEAKLRRLDWG